MYASLFTINKKYRKLILKSQKPKKKHLVGTGSTAAFAFADCFETNTSCWFQFNFTLDNSSNGCPGGTRYVRRTQYSSAPYVGVVLCSETR